MFFTGKQRPGISKTGHPPKNLENFSWFNVADMTRIFNGCSREVFGDGEETNNLLSKPNKMS